MSRYICKKCGRVNDLLVYTGDKCDSCGGDLIKHNRQGKVNRQSSNHSTSSNPTVCWLFIVFILVFGTIVIYNLTQGGLSNMLLYILIGFIVLGVLSGIRIVRPIEKGLIETLGKYNKTAEQGFSWIIPIVQRMIKVNITEQMVDIKPQTVITQDKLNAIVDAVVYFKIKDVKAAIYNVNDHKQQLASLARTTLRAVIGKMTLTEANENRDDINNKVETVLDKETDSYGVEVLRVELQKIEPPEDVQGSMNEVVKAEQLRIASKDRASAKEIEADGFKRAEIKQAEGKRQRSILEAEGKARAFELIEKTFKSRAELLKRLEVTENSLKNNSKIIVTEKGINPQLIMGDIPVKQKK